MTAAEVADMGSLDGFGNGRLPLENRLRDFRNLLGLDHLVRSFRPSAAVLPRLLYQCYYINKLRPFDIIKQLSRKVRHQTTTKW